MKGLPSALQWGLWAVVFWLTGAGLTVMAQPAPPPVGAFFSEPAFSDAAISPDGRRVAFKVGAPGQRQRLAVLDLATLKPAVVASFDDADVGQLQWVNNRRIVFDLQTELAGPGFVDRGPGLFAVDHDDTNFRQLVHSTRVFIKSPTDSELILPANTYLLRGYSSTARDDVHVVSPEDYTGNKVGFIRLKRLDTRTGRSAQVDAPLHAVDWVLEARGQLRAVVTSHLNKVAVHLRDASGGWKKLSEHDPLSPDIMSPRFVDADGKVYVLARVGRDTRAVHLLDTATGRPDPVALLASKDYDLDAQFIATDKQLLGLRFNADAWVTHWLVPEMKAMQAAVDALLPATANLISVPQRSETPFVLVAAFSDVQPTLTYVYDTVARKLTLLGRSQPAIDPRQMGVMDMLRYKARDGLEIPAYLTLPPGGARKNLPLIVYVHGGPWVRGATWRWQAEVQFLASRGYAVLQPEFRGSTGFGARHFEAGFKQWGRAMQDDLADGARWAIEQGIADPKRICIAGASYGGYATLMGLARDPDLFRCGFQWAGVTDIRLMYEVRWSDLSDEFKRYGMPRMIGDPVADAAMLAAASPIENAARIKQPLLMAYGNWDVRVPIVHGEKFRDAVKAHNPALEWIVYPNEGHGWQHLKTQVDFWSRVEKFLARHLAAR